MYYQIKFQTGEFANYFPDNVDFETSRSFDGRSRAKEWKEIHYSLVDAKDKRPVPDFISGFIPACSQKAYEYLRELCGDKVEFLPCTVGETNERFYVMNIVGLEDCVDYEKSKFIRFSNGRIQSFQHIAFTENILAPIFKIKDLPVNFYFVNEEFFKKASELPLKGWCFSNALFDA